MAYRGILFPYKLGSASASQLARALGVKRVRPNGTYRPFRSHCVVNWGNSQRPNWWNPERTGVWLNRPEGVSLATNKLETFQKLSGAGVSVPPWTVDKEVAASWNKKVIARTILNGYGGAGIVVLERGVDIPPAPLYTQYLGRRTEWRIHVFKDRVLDVQYKARKRDGLPTNYVIRNHANGWIYARNVMLTVVEEAKVQAIKAVQTCGLDFGAVDVVVKEDGSVFVLEINTAPGLQGHTVNLYAEALSACFN
jgi:Glutathione synthase/Ribosomal protein S6 modification enzyme (glutaminyl transferase)